MTADEKQSYFSYKLRAINKYLAKWFEYFILSILIKDYINVVSIKTNCNTSS